MILEYLEDIIMGKKKKKKKNKVVVIYKKKRNSEITNDLASAFRNANQTNKLVPRYPDGNSKHLYTPPAEGKVLPTYFKEDTCSFDTCNGECYGNGWCEVATQFRLKIIHSKQTYQPKNVAHIQVDNRKNKKKNKKNKKYERHKPRYRQMAGWKV